MLDNPTSADVSPSTILTAKPKGSTIFTQASEKSRWAERRNNKIEQNKVVLKTGKIYVPNVIWTTELRWTDAPPRFKQAQGFIALSLRRL